MKKKVMLTDDDLPILELVATTLGKDKRYDLFLAKNGQEALDMARLEKPDILFLDVMMPKLTGYEVCRRLKADPDTAKIKIVMLTALSQAADKKKAIEAGADDFLTKPFSPLALLRWVDEILTPE